MENLDDVDDGRDVVLREISVEDVSTGVRSLESLTVMVC